MNVAASYSLPPSSGSLCLKPVSPNRLPTNTTSERSPSLPLKYGKAAPGEPTLCMGQAVVFMGPFVGAGPHEARTLAGWVEYQAFEPELRWDGNVGVPICDVPLSHVVQNRIPIVKAGEFQFQFSEGGASLRE